MPSTNQPTRGGRFERWYTPKIVHTHVVMRVKPSLHMRGSRHEYGFICSPVVRVDRSDSAASRSRRIPFPGDWTADELQEYATGKTHTRLQRNLSTLARARCTRHPVARRKINCRTRHTQAACTLISKGATAADEAAHHSLSTGFA